VSVSFLAGDVDVEGFLEEEVSDFGGFTPFIVSIPSTVTVFPVGSFSTFSSFFVPEQEVRRKKNAAKMTDAPKNLFLSPVMDTPFY
jgi:hypothetical protein